tara:strand:- start:348 stop:698 length:351 start_codon:yes stop_codon:yes gene_type:complete
MKFSIKFIQLCFILVFLNACKTSINKEPLINESDEQVSEITSSEKNKMEIRVSCGDGDISQFLNDGWIVAEEYSEEKICSWKSYPANKDCNMEKDKGCKITTPDVVGLEKIYLLEK